MCKKLPITRFILRILFTLWCLSLYSTSVIDGRAIDRSRQGEKEMEDGLGKERVDLDISRDLWSFS